MSETFEPKSFLDLARTLSNKAAPSEAEARSAIGRAYYSLCYRIESIRRGSEISAGIDAPSGENQHQENIAYVRAFKTAESHNLANSLGNLRRLRNAADYPKPARVVAFVLAERTWKKAAEDAVSTAAKIHHWLSQNQQPAK